MLEHDYLIVGTKFILSCMIILLCEKQQARPYYYFLEIVLGSVVIAVVPLIGHVLAYALMAHHLRHYPYSIVRAWLWPVELYRTAYMQLFRRYPYRKI